MLKNTSLAIIFSSKSTCRTSLLTPKYRFGFTSKRFKTSYSKNRDKNSNSYRSKYSRFLNNMINEEESKSESGLAKIEEKKSGDEEYENVSMSSFYSLDKPKDALSGTSQGFGNILKGMRSTSQLFKS